MRYAVFSDIHGNLPALEEARDAARREGVDAYLCA
jgi:predicted phosphodiesterase